MPIHIPVKDRGMAEDVTVYETQDGEVLWCTHAGAEDEVEVCLDTSDNSPLVSMLECSKCHRLYNEELQEWQ